MALLPTPLTPAQADGALNIGEARVLFRYGPHDGQFLMVSATDPNLPDALIDGTVMAQGFDLGTTGATPVPLTITLANGNPIPNPPASYPINALVTLIGNIPSGQSFGLLSIENVQQTVPLSESGTAPTKKYTTPWVITEAGSYIVELLLASGHIGAEPFVLAPVTPPAPTNTVPPAITGTARQGQMLTVSNGTWTGSPTFARQWKADNTNIAGATANTYALTAAEVGKVITCTVTGTNAGGNASATSAPTTAVLPLVPTNTVPPVITGIPQEGETLTVSNGTWTGNPTFTRQWTADGANIARGTTGTLVLEATEEGMMIACRVTGTNAGGNSSATSAAVGPVLDAAP